MSRITLSLAFLVLLSRSASAHGVLKGAGDFYAGLLHPLVVPAEMLALVATGLLLGTSGLTASRRGLPALTAGLVIGLALGRHVAPALASPLLLALAFSAAALVTAGVRLPPTAAVTIAALSGVAVGVDAQPDADTGWQVIVAGSASVAGAAALTAVVAGLVLDRKRHWQRVAVRVAGSWITATVTLYLAWLVKALSRS